MTCAVHCVRTPLVDCKRYTVVAGCVTGELLECTLTVVNTGTVGIKDLAANNTACVGLSDLAPGDSDTCTVSVKATQADFNAWDLASTQLGLAVAVTAAPTADIAPAAVQTEVSTSVELTSRPNVYVSDIGVSPDGSTEDISAGEVRQAF